MLMVQDTFEAARDAIKRKLIPEDSIKEISIDKKKDESASKITGIREEDNEKENWYLMLIELIDSHASVPFASPPLSNRLSLMNDLS